MDIQVSKLHWSKRNNKTPVKVCSPENYIPYSVLWLKMPV
jgi:hypothetical protein